MIHILNSCTDPCHNLALEEYFLNNESLCDDLVILWRNQPTVVVGRNQNASAEVDHDFANEHGIHVVRRLSGGGAVYHDSGNLNFTFITTATKFGHMEFSRFTAPIIDALQQLGVKAEFSGRNDLTIEGRKFSGNAQYRYRNRLLHHGTVLFDTDLAVLAKVLSGPDAKFDAHAIQSIPSRLTTIRSHLKKNISITEFESNLIKAVFHQAESTYCKYEPSFADRQAIDHIVEMRYRNDSWNNCRPSSYNHSIKRRFSGGTMQVFIDIRSGTIQDCKRGFSSPHNIREERIANSKDRL